MSNAGASGVWRQALLGALLLLTCKVPITDINAFFSLSDATWFEQEQTLFFFWRLQAEQGLGEESQLEIWRHAVMEHGPNERG